MSDAADPEVPEGAAVFPLIPPELGINPLFLAVVHASVFLAGSEESVVNAEAADEAMQYIAGYLQRLEGAPLRQVTEDMACLIAYAKQQRWPRQLVQSLKSFLADFGVGTTENE
jgi:hypothetical protein